MERRPIKRLNRPLNVLGLKFLGIWLIIVATAGILAHWMGAWVLILLPLGFIAIFVVEARLGSRYFVWAILTTHCPQCGMWPMKYIGFRGRNDNHGYLICEKCQIEWDLGRGTGISKNLDLTAISECVSGIIDKQIQDNNPPETRQTMERLTREGHTVEIARQLISTVVVVEIFHKFFDRKPFDAKRFAWNLQQLPQKPWDAKGREIFYPYD